MKVINGKKDILTIPNALSLFRLILAGCMLWVFYGTNIDNKREVMTALLIVSGFTDFADGKIARRFHMISELGKILDPIADKVTQGVLLVCLLSSYKVLRIVFVLFLVKECYMAVEGLRVIQKTNQNEGAMWYGKVNTAVFYAVMFILLFVPGISETTGNALCAVSGGFMLLSFVLYARKYHKAIRSAGRK